MGVGGFALATIEDLSTGVLWQLKGKPDVLKDISIEAEPYQERLTTQLGLAIYKWPDYRAPTERQV